MLIKYTLVIVVSLLSFPLLLFGQQKLSFSHLYSDDGLSQSTIWAIAQDYQGFMWFGTFDGLNRYDGYSFKIYKHDPSQPHSLNSNGIEVIFEDSKHNLWIGTAEGLNLYDRAKDQFINFNNNLKNPNSGTAVKAIAEDHHGTIWIGGSQGISSVNVASRTLTRFKPGILADENNKRVRQILFDADENLWAVTEEGIDCYQVKKNKINSFVLNTDDPKGNASVNKALIDNKGMLWIGAGNGLFIYNHEKFEPVLPEIKKSVFYLFQRHDGSMLIALEGHVIVYNPKRKKITANYYKSDYNSGLTDDIVTSLFEDKNSNLWIGTFNGLNYTGRSPKFKHIGDNSPGLKLKSHYILSTLMVDKNLLWLGTAKGIEILDVSGDSVRQLTAQHPALKAIGKAVLSMVKIDDDNIWFTVWVQGTYQYNLRTKALKKIFNELPLCGLHLLHCDSEGRIWLGCESGLFRIDRKTNSLLPEERVKKYNINYIKQDQKRGLWLAYGLGLIHYNISTQQVTLFRDNANKKLNLNVESIGCVYEDNDGLTWIGTNHGLHVRNDSTFESFWKQNGFSDHFVSGILEDNHHNLWLSANDGLYRFNKKTKTAVRFNISDGLQGKEFTRSALKLDDGRMVFGGTKGLNIFHPDSIKPEPLLTDVVITDFKILNKSVSVDSIKLNTNISIADHINLDYNDTEFSFEFVAINFSSPEKTQYAYMLEGYDKTWNYSGTRNFASYTNLPAGQDYVFRIKASNGDNVWSEGSTALKIYIKPPLWSNWWFKMLVYSFIALAIYSVFRFRFKKLKQGSRQLIMQKRILQEQIYQRTIELHRANFQLKEQSNQLKEQAEEIAVMNEFLKEDNIKLEHNVKNLEQARVLQKWVSLEEFQKLYPDNESCYKFIETQKWGDAYQCRKCGNNKYSPGQIEFSRRCSKCNYIETITTGTIFEGVKFPINKAFYLLFLISEGKRYTLKELANIVDLRAQTCWTFKKRVIERTGNKNLQKNKDGLSQLILLS